MPIEAMSKKDLEDRPSSGGHPEYVEFIRSARVGTGGRLDVAQEGVGKQTIKNRLNTSAKVAGRSIKFMRSPATEVVFQIVE